MALVDCTLIDTGLPLTINLGKDVIWVDEWDWTGVPQQVRLAIDGAAVVETLSPQSATQPLTLKCGWQTKTTVDQLVTMRDRTDQTVMDLTLPDGRTKEVLFEHHKQPPIDVSPVVEMPSYDEPESPDWFDVVIHLFDAVGI